MPRPKSYPSDLWNRLVQAAADRLAKGGPDELSLRELAASQQTSTNAIYTIFGGKAELIAAVIHEAQSSLGAAQSHALGDGETITDLRALGVAYRRWALDHPALYQVMFGRHAMARQHDPTETYAPLRSTVDRFIDRGEFRVQDVALVSRSMWATVHGWVMLEIAEGEPLPDPAFEAHLDHMFVGYGSDAVRAERLQLT